MSTTKRVSAAFVAMVFGAPAASAQAADSFMVDLTHPIPTFQPMAGDATSPDLSKPHKNSRAIPSFGQQAVFALSEFPTSQGHFDLGRLIVPEHHGTHIDSPGHYINDKATLEAGNSNQRKLVDDLDADDLIGRIVLIDISGRVQAELDRNGGRPSPDKGVTDFSNSSPNVVGADDITGVADKLDNGVWLVLNLGWSRFFFQGTDFAKDPYINGWNHPGMNKAAVDKLIEVMDRKAIRINGIVADNIGIDSGQSAIGDDDQWTNSWHAHVRLLQRGLKFVENAANLGLLAQARADSCTLVVGAPKHVRGTGGPSRLLAMCER